MNTPFRVIRVIPRSAVALCIIAGASGCKHTIAVEPIEVKPIHMTLDINLKVDRELDEFFEDVEEAGPTTAPLPGGGANGAPTTAPASTAPEGGQS